jgi:hypothetical protein
VGAQSDAKLSSVRNLAQLRNLLEKRGCAIERRNRLAQPPLHYGGGTRWLRTLRVVFYCCATGHILRNLEGFSRICPIADFDVKT